MLIVDDDEDLGFLIVGLLRKTTRAPCLWMRSPDDAVAFMEGHPKTPSPVDCIFPKHRPGDAYSRIGAIAQDSGAPCFLMSAHTREELIGFYGISVPEENYVEKRSIGNAWARRVVGRLFGAEETEEGNGGMDRPWPWGR